MTNNYFKKKIKSLKGEVLVPKDNRDNDDGCFGRALEELLGVEENNFKSADLKTEDGVSYELKTTNGKGKTTLFSKEPAWNSNENFKKMSDFFNRYSYIPDPNFPEVRKLNTTIKSDRWNNRGFKVIVKDNNLIVTHKNDGNCMQWDIKKLLSSANNKLKNLVVIERSGDGKIVDGKVSTGFNSYVFSKMISNGQIVIETRLSMKKDSTGKMYLKNRGTCFRISPQKLDKMYNKEKK